MSAALFAATLLCAGDSSGRVSYRLRMPTPAHQLLEVTVQIESTLPLEVAMPTWTPGSFQEKRWARNLRPQGGKSEREGALRWVRTGPSRWRIEPERTPKSPVAGPRKLELRYQLYAGTLADDASHLDDEHAHLCGPSVFLLIPSVRTEEQVLQIAPPKGWRIATSLDPLGARYRARDYDELVDAPIELGRFTQLRIEHGRRPIDLVLHDGEKRPIPQKLVLHLRALLGQHQRWLGPAPYSRYLIVVHTRDGQEYRALEHASGTSLVVPGSVLSDAQDYSDLLYVIAHEHLHVWNGKRLRPAEHLSYDYLRPRPTRLLWWTEGVTDYLARRSLLAAGLLAPAAYLAVLGHEIGRVQGSPDRLRRSLADLSFEAFWPPRDPSDPALSYYAKGHVVALLLDLELRAQSGGRSSLETVLRSLGASKSLAGVGDLGVIGLDRAAIEAALRSAAGTDLAPFLARWVDRPGELDYAPALARLGLRLRTRRLAPRAELGFTAKLRGTELEVTAVTRGGAAARAGLAVGDCLLELDGRRPHGAWRALLDAGSHELMTSRRGTPIRRQLKLSQTRPLAYELQASSLAPASIRALRDRWLAP